jgi:CBS domain-containing protein
MERYGQDFDRDRWGGGMSGDRSQGGGQGGQAWRGGAFQGRQGGQDDSGFGGGRGRQGGYGGEFGSGRGGRQGGGMSGGGMGGRGGQRFGQRQGGGGGFMGGFGGGGGGGGYGSAQFGGGGYQGGYSGYEQGGFGGGGGMGRGEWGQQQDDGSRTRASEIMTDNPETVTPDATLADAARKMRDLNVGIIPVIDSQESRRLKGVITDRDIAIRAVAEGKDANSTKVSDVMTTEIEACNKNDSVRDVLSVMEREQVRRVPITDREGRLVGIIAQADVAVDYAGDRPEAKRQVARTLRQVSEPAEPESGGRQSGGGSQGGAGSQGGGAEQTGARTPGRTGARASQQRGEE